MKKTLLYKRIVSLVMCLVLFAAFGMTAFADDSADGVIDPAALQKLVEDFIAEKEINSKNFSVGYVYTGTGEEWYYNGDTWYYPASMYKVPLMMLLAEREADGFIAQETDLGGYTVARAEELILTYSNNECAHYVRTYLGGDEVWRQAAKIYSQLNESDYSPDYMDYCYFSCRYITQVMKTLYSTPERFPNIIESLLVAEPEHYYRLDPRMDTGYKIAQKYGSFTDNFNDSFNHNTGIIYTDTPFILTVMTLNLSGYEKIFTELAMKFTDYTESLETELVEYVEEQALIAEEKAEAERIEAEKKAEAERIEAEEKLEAQRMAELEAKKDARSRQLMLAGGAAILLLVFVILLAVFAGKRAKRRRMEEFERRFRQEMQQRRR